MYLVTICDIVTYYSSPILYFIIVHFHSKQISIIINLQANCAITECIALTKTKFVYVRYLRRESL